MIYVQVYLKGVRDFYTWHTSTPIEKGDRIEVLFRRTKKIGLVVGYGSIQPDFKTQPILRVIHRGFIPQTWMILAEELADKHFCKLGKILGLMFPEKFLESINPVERRKTIIPSIKYQVLSIKGAKQKELLEALEQNDRRLAYEAAQKIVSTATIKGLIDKEVISIELGALKSHIKLPPDKGERSRSDQGGLITLNTEQQTAFESIQASKKPSLLFGVTGSGKTEIYKKLVASQFENSQVLKSSSSQVGPQALILVPEIALTSQLIQSFQKVFGSALSVWNSKMSEGEKVQEWARIQSGVAKVIIGTRSSILIPIPHLRLVIVDEEHEWTYKNEFAPRFWAREVIEKIAICHPEFISGSCKLDQDCKMLNQVQHDKIKLVYGSATPSAESWYRVKKGEYTLVELSGKFFSDHKPDIQVVDLRQEIKRGNYTPISERLELDMRRVLDKGRQVVLFLNRRGFANVTLCQHCGHQFECPHCTHFMKLHNEGKLMCHVCGHMDRLPEVCPECSKGNFKWKGWGTQRLEEGLATLFPDKKVLRADRDSVSGKYDFDLLMEKFAKGEGDILLGTQMITKGLDFDRVDLVGIVLADIGLSLPDFRASERVFSQLVQVAGRTGRRENKGEILIQTFHPDLELFQYVRNLHIAQFLNQDLAARERSHMPPYSSMAKLIISNTSKEKAWMATQKLYKALKSSSSHEIHWAPAFWPRTHGKYHFHIFVKSASEASLVDFLKSFDLEGVKIDLNPASLL